MFLVFIIYCFLYYNIEGRHINVPNKGVKIFPGLYSVNVMDWKGIRNLETIAIISSLNEPSSTSSMSVSFSCCSVIALGAKWKTIIDFQYDPTNSLGLSHNFINNTITASFSEWQSFVPCVELFGNQIQNLSINSNTFTVPNGKNEIVFAIMNDENVIASTYLSGIFTGNVANRKIIEADIVFNERFLYGDATINPNFMDLQSVLTHELGHVLGLFHSPTDPPGHPQCSDATMYPSADFGETNKRTVDALDTPCLYLLYPDPSCTPSPPESNSQSNSSSLSLIFSFFMIILISFSI